MIWAVAPPRGERGLKFSATLICVSPLAAVAPPRGERGLKSIVARAQNQKIRSLPLVGSVD